MIRLERNYRSTGHILAAASHLIAHNEGRLGKTLRTEDVDGEKVTVTGSWDSEEEARAIGEEIEQLQRDGHKLNDIAILVRASFQMREFEDRFVTLGLPYRVIGGPRFYERAEVRDALAYLRVINSPADDLAFERIVNVPKRGLGDATVQMLHDHARKRRMPLFEAARAVVDTDELKPKARGSLRDLIASFDRWRARREVTSHTELAEIVLDESGYTEMWQKDRSADAAGRLENLKELVRSMEEFENLQGFLEHISLVMDRDGGAEDDAVSLMTLHSAKGLEFENVFLPGWEEGLFPSQRTLDEQGRAGLEEERRLAHVGITRARRRAKLYFATNRRIHGTWSDQRSPRAFSTNCRRIMSRSRNRRAAPAGAAAAVTARRASTMWNPSAPATRRRAGSAPRPTAPATRMAAAAADRPAAASMKASRRSQVRAAILQVRAAILRSAREAWRLLPHQARPDDHRGRADRANPPAPPPNSRWPTACFTRNSATAKVVKIDGNKLTIAFEKAGEKKVVDSFVERV